MPTYSYECGSCGHVFDVFHGMSAEPKITCESCGKKCHRLIGTGSGIIFKGSGFYETDYKDKKGVNPEKAASEKKSDGTSKKTADTTAAPSAGAADKSSSANTTDGSKKKAVNS